MSKNNYPNMEATAIKVGLLEYELKIKNNIIGSLHGYSNTSGRITSVLLKHYHELHSCGDAVRIETYSPILNKIKEQYLPELPF